MLRIPLYTLLVTVVCTLNAEGYFDDRNLILKHRHNLVPREGHFILLKSEGHQSLFNCRYQICNHVEYYPEHQINEAMKDQHTIKHLLHGMLFNASVDLTTLESRGDFLPSAEQLCQTEGSVTLTPRLMRNKNNEIKFIVNTEEYRQTFTVEVCRKFGGPELRSDSDTCSRINHKCRQSYQTLALLSYDHSGIHFDQFPIPTICRCCKES